MLIETDRQTDSQTDRQRDRQTDRQRQKSCVCVVVYIRRAAARTRNCKLPQNNSSDSSVWELQSRFPFMTHSKETTGLISKHQTLIGAPYLVAHHFDISSKRITQHNILCKGIFVALPAATCYSEPCRNLLWLVS